MSFPGFEFSIKIIWKFEKHEKLREKEIGFSKLWKIQRYFEFISARHTPIHKYFIMLLNQISFFIIYFLDNCLENVKIYLLLPTLKIKVNIFRLEIDCSVVFWLHKNHVKNNSKNHKFSSKFPCELLSLIFYSDFPNISG
jgi:hypothetical protein